jgi:hypothetical protein
MKVIRKTVDIVIPSRMIAYARDRSEVDDYLLGPLKEKIGSDNFTVVKVDNSPFKVLSSEDGGSATLFMVTVDLPQGNPQWEIRRQWKQRNRKHWRKT